MRKYARTVLGVAEEVGEAEVLPVTKILAAFEQQPAGLVQRPVTPFAFHAAGSSARTSSIALFVGDDVEPVANVQRLGTFSRVTLKHGSHISEQMKEILDLTS